MGLLVEDITKTPPALLVGGAKLTVKRITFDDAYVQGGEALTAAMCGLTTLLHVSAHMAAGYAFEYDYDNAKLLVMYGNYDAADGPLIQVAGTPNLATLVTRALIIGI